MNKLKVIRQTVKTYGVLSYFRYSVSESKFMNRPVERTEVVLTQPIHSVFSRIDDAAYSSFIPENNYAHLYKRLQKINESCL